MRYEMIHVPTPDISQQIISYDFGALIISMPCHDLSIYHQMSDVIRYEGTHCIKCAFHHNTQRAYYRSNATLPTDKQLINMDNEELVADGYLIIQRRGKMTTYIPTSRYTAGMHADTMPEPITIIQDHTGEYQYQPTAVRGLLAAYMGE